MVIRMEKEVEHMNNYLARDFGYFDGNNPNWRIVWANDQMEKRRTKFTDAGIELVHEVVVERPKYQHINERYVLERLFVVPPITDLVEKISYEPMFTFEDGKGEFLPPRYDVCILVIGSVYQAMNWQYGTKYPDPRLKEDWYPEKIAKLKETLFGNETDIGDALAHKSAVGYTPQVMVTNGDDNAD